MKVKPKVTISSVTEMDNLTSLSESESEEEIDSVRKVPRGQPKSGRFWKTPKTRTRSVVKTKGLKTSYDKKMKLKKDLAYVKALSREAIDKKNKAREDKRNRTKENKIKREANAQKSEVVQVITDSRKIKRMKKKGLKSIEKRDTLMLQK